MGTKVTLTIPDYIYQQAKHVAETNRRPLGDVINEALAQAFPAVHVSPDRPAMEQELAAFRAARQELLAKYEGQYVAVHQGQVVDHDKDRLALVTRVDEAYPGEVVLIKCVTPEPDRIIRVYSPRLVR
ncbi:MAG TPA: DUF5678 domain-containing protein [Anaerolineae bacterium]